MTKACPLVGQILEDAGIDPQKKQAAIVAANLRMVPDLVEAGSGWSVLPDYLVSESLAEKRRRRLAGHRSRVRADQAGHHEGQSPI